MVRALVARRSSLVALVLLAVLADAGDSAADLVPNAQLGVTQIDTGGNQWAVWSRDTTGRVLARRDNTSGGARWTDYGNYPSNTCSTAGVTATSWVSGGVVNERVYCASPGVIGSLYELALQNGVPVGAGWRYLGGGSTGEKKNLAATSILINGHWTVFVVFTTGFSQLWSWSQDTTVPGIGLFEQLGGAVYSQTAQVAVSRGGGASPGFLHVFAARSTNSTVDVFRKDSNPWSTWNIGSPAGVSVMGTAVAVQDQISTVSGYRVFLLCTAATENNKLYAATAISSGHGAAFAWSSLSLGYGLGNLKNSGYAIAATSRADGGANRAIEAFVLGTLLSPNRIYRTRFASGYNGLAALADIGADGESLQRTGALAAYPVSTQSSILFLGSGADSTAQRLYRKAGADLPPGDPANWSNHGNGRPWSGLPSATPHAETSAAFHEGRAIVVAMTRNGDGGPTDFPHVETLWSDWDGDSWDPAWRPIDSPFDATGDPTVDFDEFGTAYISFLGVNFIGDLCDSQGDFEAGVFYVRTDDGLSFEEPIEVTPNNNSVDHPWMEIYRDLAGNGDRVHFVWWDKEQGDVFYRSMPVGGALGDPHSLAAVWPGVTAAPPVLTVGAQGAVYARWGDWICRISGSFDGCEVAPRQIDAAYTDEDGTGQVPTQTGLSLNTGIPATVASPVDPNRVYVAFHKFEADGTDRDIFLAIGDYDADEDPPFQWNGPFTLADANHYNDDADQFQVSLTSSRDNLAAGYLFASWYDRHGITCHATANRCYRTRRAVSLNGGLTFVHRQTIPIDATDSVSDPDELPLSCLSHDPFLGHYRASRGDLLHSRHIAAGAPDGGAPLESLLATGWVSGGFYYW